MVSGFDLMVTPEKFSQPDGHLALHADPVQLILLQLLLLLLLLDHLSGCHVLPAGLHVRLEVGIVGGVEAGIVVSGRVVMVMEGQAGCCCMHLRVMMVMVGRRHGDRRRVVVVVGMMGSRWRRRWRREDIVSQELVRRRVRRVGRRGGGPQDGEQGTRAAAG